MYTTQCHERLWPLLQAHQYLTRTDSYEQFQTIYLLYNGIFVTFQPPRASAPSNIVALYKLH